jgi:hypothetical protein
MNNTVMRSQDNDEFLVHISHDGIAEGGGACLPPFTLSTPSYQVTSSPPPSPQQE